MTTTQIRSLLTDYDNKEQEVKEAIKQRNENYDSMGAKQIVATKHRELWNIKQEILRVVENLI